GIWPLEALISVEVLLRGPIVRDVGLRTGPERAGFCAGFVLVVEKFVSRLGVNTHGARTGCAGWRALVREVQSAAGEIADDRSVAVHREVPAEVERERGNAAESRRRRIVRQDDVRKLLRSDAGAGDFNFVFAGRGVEGIVAEAIGRGGIGERLGERGVGINQSKRKARL